VSDNEGFYMVVSSVINQWMALLNRHLLKIKDWSSKGHLVVGVCHRPPDQGEPVDEAFLLQLQEARKLLS